MSEKIILKGEYIPEDIDEEIARGLGKTNEVTIELSPLDISSLKEGDEVLVKHEFIDPIISSKSIQTNYCDVDPNDIVAILPRKEEYCNCGGYKAKWADLKCPICQKQLPPLNDPEIIPKQKEQPNEMPEVPIWKGHDMADILFQLIECVKDLQERYKKLYSILYKYLEVSNEILDKHAERIEKLAK